jgi:hypothetical protein
MRLTQTQIGLIAHTLALLPADAVANIKNAMAEGSQHTNGATDWDAEWDQLIAAFKPKSDTDRHTADLNELGILQSQVVSDLIGEITLALEGRVGSELADVHVEYIEFADDIDGTRGHVEYIGSKTPA